jgi:GTP-binding protein YchF
LITSKPVLYAANVSEEDITSEKTNPLLEELLNHAKKEGSEVMTVCAKIEEEIAQLDEEEREEFLKDLGLSESGLSKLIKKSYKLLGLISFLTAGPKEVRAWTIVEGSKAPQAAGKIHTDFEKGFIRAEVVGFKELVECGSYNVAKEKGLVRSEGKDYVMKDGDVTLFRFNV